MKSSTVSYYDSFSSTKPSLWDIAISKVKEKEAKLEGTELFETDKSLLILGARESVKTYCFVI